ncbi:MAG: hypothetical protein QNK03_22045 [Myxococcota bacterium]|nr:hypothetical protein [Myxococcota bacterium]
MSDERALTELIEDAVNKGATSVEEIHKRIAEMPLTVLERLGVFERTASDVKEIQETSIGAVYELIRDVNHEVAKLARELLEKQEPGESGKA